MMDKIKKQKLFSTTGLIAALVLLILINLVSSLIFSSARLDLTENNLYTLSDGTENILESLEEPVTIKFYFSEQVFASVPAIMTYGQRVKDMLKEYASIAGSKLNLQIIDPEPFSEEEDQAVQSNLQGLPLDNAGTTGYFGLVASNTVDDHETIPFLQPEKEVTLEYDLTKLIYKLSNPKKKVVGLMSGLDMTSMGQAQGRFAMPEDWVILNQLKQFYQINKLGTDIGEIPKDIDILLVVHPKDFSDKALYAIDQFLMAGGRAIMFVDPFSEAQPSMADPSNPMAAMNEKRGSNLKKFFDLWGLEMAEDKIAADRLTAARVQARVGARIAPVDYVAWLQLREGNFNQKDFVTAELKQVAVATAGSFKITQKDNIVVTPLIETTDKGSEIPTMQVQFGPDPMGLLRNYVPGNKKLPIAVRVSGDIKSAFEKAPEGVATQTHLGQSKEKVNVIVVADTDMLTDRMWVNVQNFFGQKLIIPSANNDAFLLNAVENLAGSNDLISLRSRDRSIRPFTKVLELKQEAETQFRDTEAKLQEKLRTAERKLNELQQKKDGGNSLILSSEQQAELERFREEQVKTRRELRQVQHALGKNIEDLGSWLKFINIALMPILIVIVALSFLYYRNKRLREAEA